MQSDGEAEVEGRWNCLLHAVEPRAHPAWLAIMHTTPPELLAGKEGRVARGCSGDFEASRPVSARRTLRLHRGARVARPAKQGKLLLEAGGLERASKAGTGLKGVGWGSDARSSRACRPSIPGGHKWLA